MTHDDLVDFRTTLNKEAWDKILDAVMKHKKENYIRNDEDTTSAGWEQNTKAGVAYAAGNYELACGLFSEALRLDPSNKVFLANRSACFIKLEKFDLALNDALKAIQIDGNYWKGYARAINICLILGDINQAEGFLDKLWKANPGVKSLKFRESSHLEAIKTYHLEIDKLYNEGGFEECLRVLRKAMKIATQCERYESLMTECLIMLDKFEEARNVIGNTLKKNPQNLSMIFNQGLLEYYTGRLDISVASFEQVLCRSAAFIRAEKLKSYAMQMVKLRGEGLNDLEKNRNIQAKAKFSQALTVDPTNKWFTCAMLYQRGCSHVKLESFREAFNDFDMALRINDILIEALSQRAFTHFKLNEFEDCIIDCEEYLKLKGSSDIQKLLMDATKKFEIKNPREVLEVSSSAQALEVYRAFKRLSKLYHPDKAAPGTTVIEMKKLTRKFQNINNAYQAMIEELSQPLKDDNIPQHSNHYQESQASYENNQSDDVEKSSGCCAMIRNLCRSICCCCLGRPRRGYTEL